MTMKLGWKNEANYGVNPLSPADDYVYFFGDFLEDHAVPIPWHDTKVTPIYRHGTVPPVGLVEGMKNCEFSVESLPLGADEWLYGLGEVSTNVITLGDTMRSRTVYIETDTDDCLAALGCVTKSFDFYANHLLPMQFKTNFLCAEVEEETILAPSAGSSPRYNSNLNLTSPWAWGDNNTVTLDDTDVIGDDSEIKDIALHVEHVLRTRKSDKVVKVYRVGTAVMLAFNIECKDKDNLILQALRTDDTNDFYYKWLRGSDSWQLEVNNLKFRQMSGSQRKNGQMPVYNIVGYAYYGSGANAEPVKLTVADGVTYS